jgi:hypothetical protein
VRQQVFEEALEEARKVLSQELLTPTNHPRKAVAKAFSIINHACREPDDAMQAIVRGVINGPQE